MYSGKYKVPYIIKRELHIPTERELHTDPYYIIIQNGNFILTPYYIIIIIQTQNGNFTLTPTQV